MPDEHFGDFAIRAGYVGRGQGGTGLQQLTIGQARKSMSLQLGQIAPDFEQDSTQGRIRFHEWLGDAWGVLFSHPRNFTPVCTTELGEVARLKPEWDKRDVKVIGLSVDPLDAHSQWESDIVETQGHALNFPLIADVGGKVANSTA